MSDLLPCPFCGGEAVLMQAIINTPYCFIINCRKCCGNSGHYNTKEQTIELWNRRA